MYRALVAGKTKVASIENVSQPSKPPPGLPPRSSPREWLLLPDGGTAHTLSRAPGYDAPHDLPRPEPSDTIPRNNWLTSSHGVANPPSKGSSGRGARQKQKGNPGANYSLKMARGVMFVFCCTDDIAH
jgi:hypothetical protein